MATYITDECINCGACLPECPNEAISEGEDIYLIDPEKCTECVGFHDHEACQAVCPVEVCLPDPNNIEIEAALLERSRVLHPDKEFPVLDELPSDLSRFRNPNGHQEPAAQTACSDRLRLATSRVITQVGEPRRQSRMREEPRHPGGTSFPLDCASGLGLLAVACPRGSDAFHESRPALSGGRIAPARIVHGSWG